MSCWFQGSLIPDKPSSVSFTYSIIKTDIADGILIHMGGMAGDVVALADTSVEASNPTRSTWFDEVVFPAIMISVVIHHLRICYW